MDLENILLPDSPYVRRKYMEFYEKHGYIPEFFQPYNCAEVIDYSNTLTISTGTPGGTGSCLVMDEINIK